MLAENKSEGTHSRDWLNTGLYFSYSFRAISTVVNRGAEFRVIIVHEKGAPWPVTNYWQYLLEASSGSRRHNSPIRPEVLDKVEVLYDEVVVVSPIGHVGDVIQRTIQKDIHCYSCMIPVHTYHDYRDFEYGIIRLYVCGSRFNSVSPAAKLDWVSMIRYQDH